MLVEALAAGDAVNENDLAFGRSFPYVALPHGASVNKSGGAESARSVSSSQAAAPAGGVSAGAGGTAGDSRIPLLPITAAMGGLMLTAAAVLTLRRRQTV